MTDAAAAAVVVTIVDMTSAESRLQERLLYELSLATLLSAATLQLPVCILLWNVETPITTPLELCAIFIVLASFAILAAAKSTLIKLALAIVAASFCFVPNFRFVNKLAAICSLARAR